MKNGSLQVISSALFAMVSELVCRDKRVKAPNKIVAVEILIFLSLFFRKKISFEILSGQMIHIRAQALFSLDKQLKEKEDISKCRLL